MFHPTTLLFCTAALVPACIMSTQVATTTPAATTAKQVDAGSSTGNSAGTSSGGGASATSGSGSAGGLPTTQQLPLPPDTHDCANLPADNTWQNITPQDSGAGINVVFPSAIVLDPFTSGTVWLQARSYDDNTPHNTGTGGLFMSDSCGDPGSWNYVTRNETALGLNDSWVWSMVADFDSSTAVNASATTKKAGTFYLTSYYGTHAVYKTTDAGASWTNLTPAGGLIAQTMPEGSSAANIASVTMDPSNHLHLLVASHANCVAPTKTCLGESTDGGANWSIVDIPDSSGAGGDWKEQSGPLLLGPNNWLFTTLGSDMWLTTDHGSTWNDVMPEPDSIGSIGVSSEGGGEWTTQPFFATTSGNYFVASRQHGGILTSKDAMTWTRVANAPDAGYALSAAAGGRVFLADAYSSHIFWASESDLSTWNALPDAPWGSAGPEFIKYDPRHKVLITSNMAGLMWRIVVP